MIGLSPELQALIDLAHQTSCADWAQQQGWALRRTGGELVGSCPKCGGSDRFSINTLKNVWNCRGCGVGGDVIFLVQHTEGLKLRAACERVTGHTLAAAPDPAAAARRAAEQRQREGEANATAARYREKARQDAYAVWKAAVGRPLFTVREYLRLRGLSGGALALDDDQALGALHLRCAPERSYWHNGAKLYVGPAMLAAIVQPDGRFGGLHQTWIDLGAPRGKLALPVQDGENKAPPSKKVLGVKKGCAIRLVTPDGARRMVMGEGIETTLTAAAHAFQPGTAYWAGVDLGNMSGKALRVALPAGGFSIVHDQPDMDDIECFQPPAWVEELVYLCDGDEPEKHTVDKVRRGLRRARRRRDMARAADPALPPLRIRMVPPGQAGTDLNSIAMGEDEIDVADASVGGDN